MVIENESRFFGDDGIAPFFAASPLTLLAQLRRERCYVINEGEIISSIVSTLFFVFLPTVSVWLCVRTYSTRAPLFCFFPVWVFQECVSVLASVGGKKKKRSLHWFLKSLIKGWQIFLSSCVVLKQTAGLLFPRPPPPPSVFLLPPLPPSLIPDYWGGCGGALFFTGAFVAGILHSCCARRNPDPK